MSRLVIPISSFKLDKLDQQKLKEVLQITNFKKGSLELNLELPEPFHAHNL